MEKEQIETIYAADKAEWRNWLQANHAEKQAVWLLYYKKKSNQDRLSWSDAVDESLCFGWIDSTIKPIDEDTYKQFFTKRKPKSVWSKVNKDKVERLTNEGLMTTAGLTCIATAKQNGSWTVLDEVEELLIPVDLDTAFSSQEGLKDFFLSLSKSVRKSALYRLVLAKRPETREQRIKEIVALMTTMQSKPK